MDDEPDAEPQPAAAQELAALTDVVRALEGLSADGQRRVVESALVFLGTKTTPAVQVVTYLFPPDDILRGAFHWASGCP